VQSGVDTRLSSHITGLLSFVDFYCKDVRATCSKMLRSPCMSSKKIRWLYQLVQSLNWLKIVYLLHRQLFWISEFDWLHYNMISANIWFIMTSSSSLFLRSKSLAKPLHPITAVRSQSAQEPRSNIGILSYSLMHKIRMNIHAHVKHCWSLFITANQLIRRQCNVDRESQNKNVHDEQSDGSRCLIDGISKGSWYRRYNEAM